MSRLETLVEWLDAELRTAEINDYPAAFNGLQLAHDGPVQRIAAAVDATLPVLEKAAALGPGTLLLVHHGMFWQPPRPWTGVLRRKLKVALDADLAIYSSHLPLDLHPQWGNNVLLATQIGLQELEPFLTRDGQSMGLMGRWRGSGPELRSKLELVLGTGVYHCAAGPEHIERVGVVTGGAGSEVAQAAAAGLDAFVTGEGPHWTHGLAEETGIHLFYGGHYATETFGVKELAKQISQRFGLPWQFIEHPSGL